MMRGNYRVVWFGKILVPSQSVIYRRLRLLTTMRPLFISNAWHKSLEIT